MAGAAAGTLKGTLLGALSSFTFHQIGIATLSQGERVIAHALAGGTLEVLGGGKFGHGFVSAGLSKALSPLADTGVVAVDGAINAAIGGTVSEITGGDFANGAVMAATQYAFNSLVESLKNGAKWAGRKVVKGAATIASPLVEAALMPSETRSLTAGELANARSIFGNSIPYSKVSLGAIDNKYAGGLTMDNTIGIERVSYSSDMSRNKDQMTLLIHELSHVWQYNNGSGYNWRDAMEELQRLGQQAYHYSVIDNRQMNEFRYEAQAHMIEDFYGGLSDKPSFKQATLESRIYGPGGIKK